MDIHRHPNCNHTYGAPSDMTEDQCGALPVILHEMNGSVWAESFWKPTPEQLAELNAGKAVVLGVRVGCNNLDEPKGHPVVYMNVTRDATEPAWPTPEAP